MQKINKLRSGARQLELGIFVSKEAGKDDTMIKVFMARGEYFRYRAVDLLP